MIFIDYEWINILSILFFAISTSFCIVGFDIFMTKNFNNETADFEIETSEFKSEKTNLALELPTNFEKSTQTTPGDPQKESVDDQIMKLEGKEKNVPYRL